MEFSTLERWEGIRETGIIYNQGTACMPDLSN